MKEKIRQYARHLGFDACRFTSAAAPPHSRQFQDWIAAGRHGEMHYLSRTEGKRIDPKRVLPGAQTAIVLAASYFSETDGGGEAVADRPLPRKNSRVALVARYARYRDYHLGLKKRLKDLVRYINPLGGPLTESMGCVDTRPVLERDLAERAGLGFIGKHTNLISRDLGNWFFLSEILTTLDLPPDPAEKNRCGHCARCIEACPTRAIRGPFQLDARRCISYLTIELRGPIPHELRGSIGRRVFGCDDCLEVCPWNRFAKQGKLMREEARRDLGRLDLIELLSMDEAAYQKRFFHTPLWRAKYRGLLRNTCVALGNTGGPDALAELERHVRGPDPLVAEHASWAVKQIESRGPG